MADRLDILRRAVLGAQGYIAIMAAGMFTTGHVFGYEYGTMVLVLAPFEVVLSLYAIVMARRLFGHWACGFNPVDWRGLVWMLPSFAVIAALFAALFATGTTTVSLVALVLIATNLLIGFPEELMFRGVTLRAHGPLHRQGHPALLGALRAAPCGERAGADAGGGDGPAAGPHVRLRLGHGLLALRANDPSLPFEQDSAKSRPLIDGIKSIAQERKVSASRKRTAAAKKVVVSGKAAENKKK